MDSPQGVGKSSSHAAFKSYFNSAPSTPSGAHSLKSGAQIYADFMESYHRQSPSSATTRRLRKAMPEYGDDAAGLLRNTRYHGRSTPLKGKGAPPPDNNSPGFQPSKRLVQGRSFAAAPHLLSHFENGSVTPLSMSLDSSMLRMLMHGGSVSDGHVAAGMRPMSASGERPCLKLTEHSFKGSMQGSGLEVIAEVPAYRPMRKAGTAAPGSATKARVLVLAEDVAPPPEVLPATRPATAMNVHGGGAAWDDSVRSSPHNREHMLAATWARQSTEATGGLIAMLAGGSPSEQSSRPSTAPNGMSDARRRYQEAQVANLDLFHYRHSGGICPEEYKLDDSRASAPQLSSPRPESAREAYYASRVGYATNRVKSLISASKYS